MRLDLRAVLDSTLPLAGLSETGRKPVLIAADGKLRVCEPQAPSPGRWTRFKAALVNVPLIGRLEAVRNADHAIHMSTLHATMLADAAQFREDLREQLVGEFGKGIADRVMKADKPIHRSRQGPPCTVHARKVVKMITRAQLQASECGAANNAAIASDAGPQPVVARYAQILAMAEHGGYFKEALTPPEILEAITEAQRLIAEVRLKGAADPEDRVGKAIDAFTGELSEAPFGAKQQVALRCRRAVEAARTHAINEETQRRIREINRQTMVRVGAMLFGTADSSSSQSAAPGATSSTGPSGLHPDDVDLAMLLCAHSSLESSFPERLARKAWRQWASVRNRLKAEVPDVPVERLDAVLRSIGRGRTELSEDTLLELTREKMIVAEMERQFDPQDPESALWNALVEATAKRPQGLNANLTRLMTTLEKEMINDVDFRAPRLHEYFKCPPSLPTVIAKTREQLIENAKQAAVGHLDALEEIGRSTTLTAQQKSLFNEYAGAVGDLDHPRRLDPVLVLQCQSIADTVAAGLPRMQDAVEKGDPAVLFDSMMQIETAYRSGMRAILDHAEKLWVSRSFDGTDSEQELFELCVKLALAKLRHEDRGVDIDVLAGRASDHAPVSAARVGERREVGFDDASQQFRHACDQSPSMAVSKLGMFYGDILRVAAGGERAWPWSEGARDSEGSQPPAQRGPLPALYRTRPELLVRTLAHHSCSPEEGGALDERGVPMGSPAGRWVRNDFNLADVRNPERHAVKLDPDAAPPASLPDALAGLKHTLEHADILIGGQRLTIDPSDPDRERTVATFSAFLAQESRDRPDEETRALAALISGCLSADALKHFKDDVDAAAFHQQIPMSHLRDVHEVWREPDGSWRIRSTHVSHPTSPDGEMIATDGVILYTLTHRIDPPGDGRAAQVELSDSKVVFAF